MAYKEYAFREADFVAEGQLCMLRFITSPALKREQLVRVEAHDWSVADAERISAKNVPFGLADRYSLLTIAASALSMAGEKELAATVEDTRGQCRHGCSGGRLEESTTLP